MGVLWWRLELAAVVNLLWWVVVAKMEWLSWWTWTTVMEGGAIVEVCMLVVKRGVCGLPCLFPTREFFFELPVQRIKEPHKLSLLAG